MADTLRKDIREKIQNGDFHCEKELTLSVISGKYKIVIIWHLGHEGIHRFSELQKIFPNISHKMLTQQLKELMDDGIVHREVYPEVPPRVEYSITELGLTLVPLVDMMYEWGKARMDDLKSQLGIMDDNEEVKCCKDLDAIKWDDKTKGHLLTSWKVLLFNEMRKF